MYTDIKTSSGLAKHLKEVTNIEVDVAKISSNMRVYWAVNNTLHKYVIPVSVVYTMKLSHIEDVINAIKKTLDY
jgi:hypothetical protein